MGTGRARSAGVRRASASIRGVVDDAAGVSVQSACFADFLAGSAGRRRRSAERAASGTDAAGADVGTGVGDSISEACVTSKSAFRGAALGADANDGTGFCAISIPSASRSISTVNPALTSSGCRLDDARLDSVCATCSVPRGVRLCRTFGKNEVRRGRSSVRSVSESTTCTEPRLFGDRVVAAARNKRVVRYQRAS